jgi:molybdopterin-binding protein
MKISARNILKGRIKAVTLGAGTLPAITKKFNSSFIAS